MRGWYRDAVRGPGEPDGQPGPWRPNTLVAAASTGLAGLFLADPRMDGVAKLAVGAGLPSWDRRPSSPERGAMMLIKEFGRVAVEASYYVDGAGQRTNSPTPSIELVARLSFSRTCTLREFGVFIGEGSDQRDGGVMINNVTHARLVLDARRELIRRVRFDFLPETRRFELDHWLLEVPVSQLSGIELRGNELGDTPPMTLGELATSTNIPTTGRAPALQGIARQLLDNTANVELVPELAEVSLHELIRSDVNALTRRYGSDSNQTTKLRRRLDGLSLLSDELLKRTTLRRLVQG